MLSTLRIPDVCRLKLTVAEVLAAREAKVQLEISCCSAEVQASGTRKELRTNFGLRHWHRLVASWACDRRAILARLRIGLKVS